MPSEGYTNITIRRDLHRRLRALREVLYEREMPVSMARIVDTLVQYAENHPKDLMAMLTRANLRETLRKPQNARRSNRRGAK